MNRLHVDSEVLLAVVASFDFFRPLKKREKSENSYLKRCVPALAVGCVDFEIFL